jgi:microcystin-dependent protein
MEPYLGQIQAFGFTFAPRGWSFCLGQQISLSQNTALFSLLGTTYGGNGQTTFGLPDLRGRSGIGQGQGPGLSDYQIGQMSGVEATTLTLNNMPIHNHAAVATPTQSTVQINATLQANSAAGSNALPATGNYLAGLSGKTGFYATSAGTTVDLAGVTATGTVNGGTPTVTVGNAGGSMPLSILNPYLALNFCIAVEGIFPSRN